MKHSIVVFVMCATPVKMHGPEARARDIGWKSMPPTIVRSSATLATYTYDWLHFTQRRVKTTATVATYVTHKLEYDSYNRIRRITNLGEPNGRYVLLAAFDYTYDIVGNRVSTIGEGNQAADPDVTYDYDGLYRLTEAQYPDLGGSETFRYDKLGNRDGDGTGDVYGYTDTRYGTPSGTAEIAYGANNAVNEYDSIAGVTVNYDAAGNLAKDEKGLSYEYDLDNKLTRIYDDDNSDGNWDSGEDRYLEFSYDALGRRIQTKDYADSPSNPKITRFYWDGQNVISEYVYNGSTYDLTRWYIHGPTYIDERVIVKDVPNSKEYYYFQKELYSVAGLADKDGKLKEAYAYDAYGKVRIYQPNPIAGDSDSDKDVDLEDFAAFANCFDEDVTVNTGCAWANVIDESSDIVDLDDYGAVYPCMTGPFAPLGATGDWNGDSQVNTTDLTAFMTCWLSTPTDSTCLTKFDFDDSGSIDLEDYGVMLSLVYPTTATCLTPLTLSDLNPYYATGQRLALIESDLPGTPIHFYDYRARDYRPIAGHFTSRDPGLYVDGSNLYQYVSSSPSNWVDWSGAGGEKPTQPPPNQPGSPPPQGGTPPAQPSPPDPKPAPSESCGCRVHRQWIKLGKISDAKNPRIGDNAYEQFIGHTWIECDGGSIYDFPQGFQDDRREKSETIWGTTKMKSGRLKAGKAKGKACCDATCDDIQSCLQAVEDKHAPCGYSEGGAGVFPPPGGKMNCRYHVIKSLRSCCLSQNLFPEKGPGIGL